MSVYGADSCSGRLHACRRRRPARFTRRGAARGAVVARYYTVAGVAVPEGVAPVLTGPRFDDRGRPGRPGAGRASSQHGLSKHDLSKHDLSKRRSRQFVRREPAVRATPPGWDSFGNLYALTGGR